MNDHIAATLDSISFDTKQAAYVRKVGDDYSTEIRVYNGFNVARGAVRSGLASVIESKWLDYRGNSALALEHYGLPDILKETTYQDCTDCRLDVRDLTLNVVLYNGDMLHGEKTDKRCQWKIQLSAAVVEESFGKSLDRALIRHLDDDYEDEQMRQKAARMREIFLEQYVTSAEV
jgi:hypothetical protein